MTASKSPATLVLCAIAPRQSAGSRGGSWLDAARALAVPVTWVAAVESMANFDGAMAGVDVAIDVPPAACASRTRLRDLLGRARAAAPSCAAAVLRGPMPPEHRGVLVEHGIAVALVDAFDEDGRGSRRPAPRGWACRSAVWGLWEVRVTPARRRGLLGWLGVGGLSQPQPGSLQVLCTDGLHSGNNAATFVASRLERWIAWASHHQARGSAIVTHLSALPAIISSGGRAALSGSVLRAA
jgi:lysophospholipase L1-like esterase